MNDSGAPPADAFTLTDIDNVRHLLDSHAPTAKWLADSTSDPLMHIQEDHMSTAKHAQQAKDRADLERLQAVSLMPLP